ncbi:5-formyltetrahydrofolate cyclo-ligase, partial [Lysobacteraceae bacterium NML120232]
MHNPLPDRQELRQRRRAIPAQTRIQAAAKLAEQILSIPGFPARGYIAGYWAMDGEISLHALQLRLPADCIWCLPVLDEARKVLKFAPWRMGDALVSNRYGIPEPDFAPSALLDAQQMALIVLPLTGFDHHCHRLGMGGGWYDRSLAFRQQSNGEPPLLVGAGFSLQEVPSIRVRSWDIACDYIATESGLFKRAGV